jgi:hypothetical protein
MILKDGDETKEIIDWFRGDDFGDGCFRSAVDCVIRCWDFGEAEPIETIESEGKSKSINISSYFTAFNCIIARITAKMDPEISVRESITKP